MQQTHVCLGTAQHRQLRVVCRHAAAEDTLHTLHKLRREGYLGHQHQHIAPRREGLGHKVHIYFGLTRAGNTAQQVCRHARGPRRAYLRRHAALRLTQTRRREEDASAPVCAAFTLRHLDISRLAQRREDRRVDIEQAARHSPVRIAAILAECRYRLQSLTSARGAAPYAVTLRRKPFRVAPRPGQGDILLRTRTEHLGRELLLRRAAAWPATAAPYA